MSAYESWDFEPTRDYEEMGTVVLSKHVSFGADIASNTTIYQDTETGIAVLNREAFEAWVAAPVRMVRGA